MKSANYPEPLRKGTRTTEDGESWTSWWLFPLLSPDQVLDVAEDYELCRSHHTGPGGPFTSAGWVRSSRSYTLFTQEGGWDV